MECGLSNYEASFFFTLQCGYHQDWLPLTKNKKGGREKPSLGSGNRTCPLCRELVTCSLKLGFCVRHFSTIPVCSSVHHRTLTLARDRGLAVVPVTVQNVHSHSVELLQCPRSGLTCFCASLRRCTDSTAVGIAV